VTVHAPFDGSPDSSKVKAYVGPETTSTEMLAEPTVAPLTDPQICNGYVPVASDEAAETVISDEKGGSPLLGLMVTDRPFEG